MGGINSGGRNRKSTLELERAGTWRKDRHSGPGDARGGGSVQPQWTASIEALAALGAAGRAFLDGLASYPLIAAEGALVLEAARAADAVDYWRERAAKAGVHQATATRLLLGWSRHYTNLAAQVARVCHRAGDAAAAPADAFTEFQQARPSRLARVK